MNIPYVFRKCTKCGEWLVASSVNFHKVKRGKYGLTAQCKKCRKKYREANKEHIAEYKKQYYGQNKEAITEYKRQYYKQNKEAIAEHNRQYYKANKEHIAEHNRQYYQDNKEAIAEYRRQYRQDNKEAIAEINRRYYEANKETIAEWSKKYREDNKEAIAEQKRQWREANKEHIAEINKQYIQSPQGQVVAFNGRNKRRAKEQNQGRGITKEQWLEMMSFFNWECAYSGKTLTKETRSIDHIDPISKGGEHEIWNCIPMDRSLNISKKDREMLDWYVKQEFCTAERLLKILEWQEYAFNKWGIDTEAQ